MGVKSTVSLTRDQAIEKAVALYVEVNQRRLRSRYTIMSDAALEDALMYLNDDANGGEGFENYSIQC